jgi:hypothetical protein
VADSLMTGYFGCVLNLIDAFLIHRKLTQRKAWESTGLSQTSITRYFSEFAARGWIRAVGVEKTGGPGKSATVWEWSV